MLSMHSMLVLLVRSIGPLLDPLKGASRLFTLSKKRIKAQVSFPLVTKGTFCCFIFAPIKSDVRFRIRVGLGVNRALSKVSMWWWL